MPADGSHWSCDRCTWLLPSPLLEHALPKITISEHVKNITRFYLPHYLFLSANKLFLMLMFLPAFIINYQRNSWKKPALPNNTLWKRHYFFFKLLKNIPEVYFLCEVFVVMGVQRFVDSRMRKRCHHLKVSQPKVSIATDSQHNLSPCLKKYKKITKNIKECSDQLCIGRREKFLDIFFILQFENSASPMRKKKLFTRLSFFSQGLFSRSSRWAWVQA